MPIRIAYTRGLDAVFFAFDSDKLKGERDGVVNQRGYVPGPSADAEPEPTPEPEPAPEPEAEATSAP